MTADDVMAEAVKAAAEADLAHAVQMLRGPVVECRCGWQGDTYDEHREHKAEAAVAAAAPLLLAPVQAEVERLRADRDSWAEAAGTYRASRDASDARADAERRAERERDEARAEVERLRADLRESARAIDHYVGALRTTPEIVAAERRRIAAAIRADAPDPRASDPFLMGRWAGSQRAARIAEGDA